MGRPLHLRRCSAWLIEGSNNPHLTEGDGSIGICPGRRGSLTYHMPPKVGPPEATGCCIPPVSSSLWCLRGRPVALWRPVDEESARKWRWPALLAISVEESQTTLKVPHCRFVYDPRPPPLRVSAHLKGPNSPSHRLKWSGGVLHASASFRLGSGRFAFASRYACWRWAAQQVNVQVPPGSQA